MSDRAIERVLFVIVGILGVALVCNLAQASDDLIDATVVQEIIDDCEQEPDAREPGPLTVIPVIGGTLDKSIDRTMGGPGRRAEDAANKFQRCVVQGIEGRRQENEREAERNQELRGAREVAYCNRFWCATQDSQKLCDRLYADMPSPCTNGDPVYTVPITQPIPSKMDNGYEKFE